MASMSQEAGVRQTIVAWGEDPLSWDLADLSRLFGELPDMGPQVVIDLEHDSADVVVAKLATLSSRRRPVA